MKKTKYEQNAASAEKYRAANDIKTLGITCKQDTRDRWKAALKKSGMNAEGFLNHLIDMYMQRHEGIA